MKRLSCVGSAALAALFLASNAVHAEEPSDDEIAQCVSAAKLQGGCGAAFAVESVNVQDRASALGAGASFGGFTNEAMATITFKVLQRGAGTGCLWDHGWMLQPNITAISVPYHLYLRKWSSGWKCIASYPGGTISWRTE